MTDKFIRKYMRFAKLVGDDQNPCLSRGIGSVIVDPSSNRIVSTGYNGPARGVPHMDTYEALKEFIYPQLTDEDKDKIDLLKQAQEKFPPIQGCEFNAENFAQAFEGCKTCPRRLVGARSGERLDLCGCVHSEANACLNANENCNGYYLFAYCGVPCLNCAKEVINKGIKRVYCLAEDSGPVNNTYESWRSQWKFGKAGVEVIQLERTWIHANQAD